MSIDNQFYAFPQVHEYPEVQVVDFGLTKREWLAGQALNGLLSQISPSAIKDLAEGKSGEDSTPRLQWPWPIRHS